MKKLLLAALLLLPLTAHAQVGPEVYRVTTPAQVYGFDSTTTRTITAAVLTRMIRAVCTSDCFIWVNLSGQSFPVSKTTGVFLPADVPILLSVSPDSKVSVVGDTTTGTLHILELSK